jgi:hypothetical protein
LIVNEIKASNNQNLIEVQGIAGFQRNQIMSAKKNKTLNFELLNFKSLAQ